MLSQEASAVNAQWQPASPLQAAAFGQWPPQALQAPMLYQGGPNAAVPWPQQAFQGAAMAYEQVPQMIQQAPQPVWGGTPMYEQPPQMFQQVPPMPPSASEYMMPVQPVRFLG